MQLVLEYRDLSVEAGVVGQQPQVSLDGLEVEGMVPEVGAVVADGAGVGEAGGDGLVEVLKAVEGDVGVGIGDVVRDGDDSVVRAWGMAGWRCEAAARGAFGEAFEPEGAGRDGRGPAAAMAMAHLWSPRRLWTTSSTMGSMT